MKNHNFVGMDAVKKQKKDGWASGKRCVKITVNTEENPVENRSPPEPYGDNAIFIEAPGVHVELACLRSVFIILERGVNVPRGKHSRISLKTKLLPVK